ncbi:DUF134 domain-containing protein [Brachymonas sp. G13]|uniref:DUF134 domain-containing protein n=1 Tax=Brachymonas TaxID=28219 RepID=UPI002E763FE6|nr:DUF134 domain-containing protein [Brachymonas sp. J145]MEE1652287.1 DUF134 domain-containing protein [Brachymonas sp. J145]
MARPYKSRHVSCDVVANYFKPRGIPVHELEEVVLELDELEALRLADVEQLYQIDAAMHMCISRQTFGNIVARARNKVATAILHGKALRINDGNDTDPAATQPDDKNGA